MFTIALIVFRESLEAALFVGIVAAATRGLAGRGRWLGAGVAAGGVGAVILALLAQQLSGWLDGLGQDVANIGILALALLMLLWHCIWVSTHSREMAGDARHLGQSVHGGRKAPWALLVVVALAVLREALAGAGLEQEAEVMRRLPQLYERYVCNVAPAPADALAATALTWAPRPS